MTTELLNTVSSSFNTVSGYALSALNVILPIALGIFAILFVWVFAVRFFLKIGGGKRPKKWDETHTGDMWDRDTSDDEEWDDD